MQEITEGTAGLGDVVNVPPNTNTLPVDDSNTDFVGPAWAKDLKLNVEREILVDPALGPITDLNSLVKSYVHAQRKIGQKGVLIPSENSSKEEWDDFYQKVGVPLEEQKYLDSVKFDKEKVKLDEGFQKEFLKMAHNLRMQPKQAQQVFEFFDNQAKSTSERFMKQTEETMQQELDKLRDEWGPDAYNAKLGKTAQYIKETIGQDFLTYLGQSGLGKNAQIVKAFASIADKYYKEDNIPSGSTSTMTISDIQKEINTIMSNFDDPYHKSSHSDHKRRVDEVHELFAKLDKAARN